MCNVYFEPGKVVLYISDNGANFKKAGTDLADLILEEELGDFDIDDGALSHLPGFLPCAEHTL